MISRSSRTRRRAGRIFGASVNLKASISLFRQGSGVVVAGGEFEVNSRDFHFLCCVLDAKIGETDLAVNKGEGAIGVQEPPSSRACGLARRRGASSQVFILLVEKYVFDGLAEGAGDLMTNLWSMVGSRWAERAWPRNLSRVTT